MRIKKVFFKKRLKGCLLVKQNASKALEICHRGYVFEIGKIAIEGERETLLNNEEIKRVLLGG